MFTKSRQTVSVFLEKVRSWAFVVQTLTPIKIVNTNTSDLGIQPDYISVPSLEVPTFVSWLVTFMKARVLPGQDWNSAKMLVQIPELGVCKIYRAKVYELQPDAHLPIRVNSIEKTISHMEKLGIKCQGEKHWRIFEIRNTKQEVIGQIHAAER
jgi:hypothetical protein